VADDLVGDALAAQGNLAGALQAYRDEIAISERLTKSDANNIGSQRDLSVAAGKIGIILLAQGHVDEALASLANSLDVAQRVAASDPSNAGWQRDVAISYNRLGSAQYCARSSRRGACLL
jgi:predicted negative regulator of RcsB-dependent stress response